MCTYTFVSMDDLLTIDLDMFAEMEQSDIEAKLSIYWLV